LAKSSFIKYLVCVSFEGENPSSSSANLSFSQFQRFSLTSLVWGVIFGRVLCLINPINPFFLSSNASIVSL